MPDIFYAGIALDAVDGQRFERDLVAVAAGEHADLHREQVRACTFGMPLALQTNAVAGSLLKPTSPSVKITSDTPLTMRSVGASDSIDDAPTQLAVVHRRTSRARAFTAMRATVEPNGGNRTGAQPMINAAATGQSVAVDSNGRATVRCLAHLLQCCKMLMSGLTVVCDA